MPSKKPGMTIEGFWWLLNSPSRTEGKVFMRIVTAIIAATFVIAFAITAGAQQQLTPEQQTILHTTINAEGWLTAEEHKRFWAPILPQLKNPEAVGAWRRTMDRFVGLSMKFQLETWKSLQLSEHEGRIVKTTEYEDAKHAVLADPLLGAQSGIAIQNAEGMFQAAATKSAFSTVRGPMYLSADMIERTLSGIEGSFCRIHRLGEPKWKDEATEYKYPAAHLNILNSCPLAVEQSQITTRWLTVFLTTRVSKLYSFPCGAVGSIRSCHLP